MGTPHINAEAGDFAGTCLLPGDPLRAEYVAENFLEDAIRVTDVRGMLGFTGSYRGERISVMGTGMGIPSALIYVTELAREYGVSRLIRIGSCGGLQRDVALRDIVIAMGACTDSAVNRSRFAGWDFAAIADYSLLAAAVAAAHSKGKTVRVGNVYTSDVFYHGDTDWITLTESLGILAVDMETAGIYGVAAELGVKALSIMTVSDHVITQETTSSEERQTTFGDMVEIALEVAAQI